MAGLRVPCSLVLCLLLALGSIHGQSWSPTQQTPDVGILLGNESGFRPRTVNVVTDALAREADSAAWQSLATKQEEDRYFFNLGVDTKQIGTSVGLHANFISTKKASIEVGESGLVFTKATQNLARKISLDPIRSRSLPTLSQNFPKPQFQCPYQTPRCDRDYPFRTADGSCNNLGNPLWGKAVTPMQRFIAPRYQDGVSAPRELNLFGFPLTSTRKISTTVHEHGPKKEPKNKYNHMLMQWGQFVDHDITSTPFEKGLQESDIICCEHLLPDSVRRRLTRDLKERSACFPIPVPPGDNHYNETCMNFVRSIQAPSSTCNFGYREQLNQITAYIDASNVYGSSIEEQWQLRSGFQGQLKTSDNQLLPRNAETGCLVKSRREYCFKAGDDRVNEQMALASLHTIWMREHNRLASQLALLNPGWNDERLFQEARKIVAAMMQHITYSEWLPLILNKRQMNSLQLTPKKKGFSDSYDPGIDASIRNAFATAAFRFGHTLVRSVFHRVDDSGKRMGNNNMLLKDMFARPTAIFEPYGKGVSTMVRGLLLDPLQTSDRFMSNQLTNHLFEDPRGQSLDLAALNIQRGRDHGIPPYNVWRVWCGLPRAMTFGTGRGGLTDHTADAAAKLQRVYANPDDIDLFSGGISEKPINGGLVGRTFACIISRQFKLLMSGDRFWYERGDSNTGFTQAQLKEIRKVKLSKVLCRNSGVKNIQPHAFLRVSRNNKKKNCGKIGYLDLSKWSNCTPGGWSRWGSWSSCRNNQQWRYRDCNNPPPSAGCSCSGDSAEVRNCQACNYNWYTGRCE
ncbi:peroxidasin-like [Liolophura sinensis]|uniref:peroxidasin-like n=1 Tax=Liolophura sinensis TaxID=3198878 RepID=UPI003158B03E